MAIACSASFPPFALTCAAAASAKLLPWMTVEWYGNLAVVTFEAAMWAALTTASLSNTNTVAVATRARRNRWRVPTPVPALTPRPVPSARPFTLAAPEATDAGEPSIAEATVARMATAISASLKVMLGVRTLERVKSQIEGGVAMPWTKIGYTTC